MVKGVVAGAVLERIMPDVPAKAIATIHGKVEFTVKVSVDANGSVTDAALDSHTSSPYFTRFALDAARAWKFRPAQVDGRNSASSWTIEFIFRQEGIEAHPAELTP